MRLKVKISGVVRRAGLVRHSAPEASNRLTSALLFEDWPRNMKCFRPLSNRPVQQGQALFQKVIPFRASEPNVLNGPRGCRLKPTQKGWNPYILSAATFPMTRE